MESSKRIDGDGWEEALELYKAQADDLHAGRTPRVVHTTGLTVMELCNQYLNAKRRKLEAGEVGRRTLQEAREATDLVMGAFGKNRLVEDLAADDFATLRADMAKRWGPVRLGNMIGRIRSVFQYAFSNALIDRPVRYGSEFQKPGKAVLRKHRASNGQKLLDAAQCRKLIAAADVPLRAMLYLGLNAAYGNTDCAQLPIAAFAAGWLTFPRPKTGIDRRCPLWPETIEALQAAIEHRPKPEDDAADLVFLTSRGTPWVRITENAKVDHVAIRFRKLAQEVGVHRKGIGFYVLRHIFRTIADGARDRVAIDLIMGHSDPSMGAVYREHIDDSRLVAVTDHVHGWLFGDDESDDSKASPEETS